MRLITERKQMAEICHYLQMEGKTIGFVPTMGFLHAGHMSLMERAKKENKIVVASIFVNPAQFAPREDFAAYPRDLEHDQKILEPIADYLFYPAVEEMYLPDEHFRFEIKDLASCLCGISRPDHFSGVVLILNKLLHIIQPQNLYMGQKDYQQYLIVKKMVQEFFFSTKVVLCPTIREKDGLAMSSRNVFLQRDERKQASLLYESLLLAHEMLENGQKDPQELLESIKKFLKKCTLATFDYIDIRAAYSLKSVERISDEPVIIALAAYFSKTRLIDNILFPNFNV